MTPGAVRRNGKPCETVNSRFIATWGGQALCIDIVANECALHYVSPAHLVYEKKRVRNQRATSFRHRMAAVKAYETYPKPGLQLANMQPKRPRKRLPRFHELFGEDFGATFEAERCALAEVCRVVWGPFVPPKALIISCPNSWV